jgi:hypothetical protein
MSEKGWGKPMIEYRFSGILRVPEGTVYDNGDLRLPSGKHIALSPSMWVPEDGEEDVAPCDYNCEFVEWEFFEVPLKRR